MTFELTFEGVGRTGNLERSRPRARVQARQAEESSSSFRGDAAGTGEGAAVRRWRRPW